MEYQCPTCKEKIEWRTENPFRPFCSDQCKNKDFLGWTNEEHRIKGNDAAEE